MESIPYSVETYLNDPNFPISPTEPIELEACPICTRKFVLATLTKHVGICERMATKKRKKFDSFRQRREGTDLADYLPKNFGLPTAVNNTVKQQTITEPKILSPKILSPKIQIQESTPESVHKQFEPEPQNSQNTQKKATLKPISPTNKQIRPKNVVKRLAPTAEQCPHCARSFGLKAFDRHVDWCKEKNRLQAVKNNADLRTAKERLEARTKYKAPNLKAKREAIRSKYSGNGDDGHSIDDNRSVDNNIFSMSNSLSSSFMSDGPSEDKKTLNSELSLKAQKINTEGEATINVKNKSGQKPKTSKINTKKKKQPVKTDKNKSEIKVSGGNEEDNFVEKDELNLIGLSLSFDNETENHEEDDDNFNNDEISSVKNTPLSGNTEEISHEKAKDIPTVDRIEIEEIIPLNSKQYANFDDTPIRPAKNIFSAKPIIDFDENPIRPTKKILNDEPSLILPALSVNETGDCLPTSSPKSVSDEKPLNEIVENLPKVLNTVNDDKLRDNYDEMPIRPSKTLSKNKHSLPIVSNKKNLDSKKNSPIPSPVKENIKIAPEPSSSENNVKNSPKNNSGKNTIKPAKKGLKKKSATILPKTDSTNTVESKPNSLISSAKLIVKEKSCNEVVENLNESLKTSDNFDDTPIRPAKNIFNDKPINDFDETPIRPSKKFLNVEPSLTLPTVSVTETKDSINSSVTYPPTVIDDKPMNEIIEKLPKPVNDDKSIDNFDEMPIRPSKKLSNNKSSLLIVSNKKNQDSPILSSAKEDIKIEPHASENFAKNYPKDTFDEIPIKPAKRVIQKKPAPNTVESKTNSPISSAKLTIKEKPINEFVENLNESLKTVIEYKTSNNFGDTAILPAKTIFKNKPINDFDETPIRPSKEVFNDVPSLVNKTEDLNKTEDYPIFSSLKENTVIESDPPSLENIPKIYAKDNFADISIKATKRVFKEKSTTNIELSKTNSPISSAIKEKPLNELVENLNDSLKTLIEDEPYQSKKILKIEPINNTDEIKFRSSNPIVINSPTKIINSIQHQTLKEISTGKHVPDINESLISLPKVMEANDLNEKLVHPANFYGTKKTIKKSDEPKEILKKVLKDASYINKLPSNSQNNSYKINPEPDNIKRIRSPQVILKDNFANPIDEFGIRKSKPILRNRSTKSANDIPNKSPKTILKDTFTNSFNQIPSSKMNSNSKSSNLSIISNKKVEENEIRTTRKLSLKTLLPPISRPSVASLSSEDFDKLLSSSDLINGRRESQSSFEFTRKSKKLDDKISLPKVFSRDSFKSSSLNDSSENFWMEISYGTKSGTKIERSQLRNKSINEHNYNLKSGFSDKYDPFLSAKRQLEELCSPTAEAESPFMKKQYPQTTSTPITIKPKLTPSLSTSYTAPSPNPRNTLNSVKSNFRRTSSLRSPRKSTPCPRPLFVPPSRCSRPTTIQRGLSDEGPISTNFIRPEEYDEMPVKSACINNFATAINSPQFARRDSSPQKLLSRSTSRESSPLVVKRDPNSNLNRRNLRLNLGNNKELNNSSSNNIPLLKTDSLAVFLKYENDLMKNPSDKLISILNQKGDTQPIVLPQQNSTTTTPPVSNLISEKDWKDKSNTLSKQSSLKNSSGDLVEKTFGNGEKEKLTLLKNSLTNLLDNNSGNNNNKINDTPKKLPPTINSPPDLSTPMPSVNKSLPIKLEPLHQKVYKNTSTPPPSKTQSTPVVTSSLAPLFPQIKSTPMTVAINNNLINLNSILNVDSKEMDNSNFIDPKLINICDNLHVNTTTNETSKLSDNSDLTSGGSQDSAYRPKTVPNKLTDERHSSGRQSSESVIEKSPSPPTSQQRKEQYQRQTSSNRNSSDKKNLLKRQIRLGKNQFLYDASPSDTEPSPDPIINKSQDDLLLSSNTLTTTHLPLVESSEKQFDSLLSPSNNPIFNDFNFEEFLSSFEASNDDDEEQFPGFKDCKEFLMNRCLNMRSMNFINNNNNSNFFNNNNTQNSIRSRKIDLDPIMMLNDSSTNIINSNNDKRQSSHDDDDDVQMVHDEREIFISIETDQNENETSNPCPNDPSIKNPKIEEINGNDNKFTKIETFHLPIFEEKDENLTTDFINDVTIRRNNVKNKQQHGNIKENETCDSVTSMYPVDSDERSSVECYPIGRRSVKSKTSADSAYGSLSRQSPILTDRSSARCNSASRNNNRLPIEQINSSDSNVIQQSKDSGKSRNRELSASSSGSENSLPPIRNYHQQQQQQNVSSSECSMQNTKDSFSPTAVDGNNFNSSLSPSGQHQMSKFCHECGSKFLVAQAKFCMECGVKRIILK